MKGKTKNIVDVYRERIENYRPAPPDYSWEHIEQGLDVDHIWMKIEKRLNKKKALLQLRNFSSVILLVSIGIIAVFQFIKPPAEKVQPAISKTATADHQTTVHPQPSPVTAPGSETASATEEQRSVPLVSPQDKPSVNYPEPVITAPVENADAPLVVPAVTEVLYFVSPLSSGSIPHSPVSPDIRNPVLDYHAFSLPDSLMLLDNRQNSWHFGLTGNLANTWLLNATTRDGFGHDPSYKTIFQAGYSLGIVAGWYSRNKSSIQLEALLIDKGGQRYRHYIGDRMEDQELTLSYLTGALLYKYRIGRSLSFVIPTTSPILKRRIKRRETLNNATNLIVGLYGSYLYDASEFMDDQKTDITPLYHNMDFGFITGLEFNYRIRNALTLAPGIRFNYGLTNIYKGNEMLPASSGKTHRGSVAFNLGIWY